MVTHLQMFFVFIDSVRNKMIHVVSNPLSLTFVGKKNATRGGRNPARLIKIRQKILFSNLTEFLKVFDHLHEPKAELLRVLKLSFRTGWLIIVDLLKSVNFLY